MSLYEHISANKRKTWLLMAGFLVFIAFLGYTIGIVWLDEPYFVIPLLIFAIFVNLGSYFYSDKIALSMSGARKVSSEQEPVFYNLVENMSIASGLPMPETYVIETPSLNAFATGRDPRHSALAVTRGLLQSLDKRELEGVIAHELSHIQNYDIRVMTITVVLVGLVAMLTHWTWRMQMWGGRNNRKESGGILVIFGILALILAPIIANIIKFAVSRSREYLADASAARMTRLPIALANALEKIAQSDTLSTPSYANTATAHLFISDPFRKINEKTTQVFSTHPPVEERIRRLRRM